MTNNDYYYDNYRLTEFYDDLYDYQDDFELWSQFLRPGSNVLEVACGTGRLTKLLLENGTNIKVDAIDYSEEMIEVLKDKINSWKINEGNRLQVSCADMRTIRSDTRYDLIIIPSNSLNHIETNEDLEKTIDNMYEMLTDGGYLLLDILNPKFEYLIRDPMKRYDGFIQKHSKTRKYFHTEESSLYNSDTQINNVTYYYYFCDEEGNRDDDSPEYKLDIKVRLFFPREFDYYIHKSQFKKYEKYGWYDKRPFDGNTPEQIYVLQR